MLKTILKQSLRQAQKKEIRTDGKDSKTLLIKAKEYGDDKVQLAIQTYELVCCYIFNCYN